MKKLLVAALGLLICGSASCSDPIWNNLNVGPVGIKYRVSPGQVVYSELRKDKVRAYELRLPIKSKMKGGLGLKFWFSLEPGLLTNLQSAGGWTYYGVRKGKAKAWHGLAGDVLAEEDHVGIRESQETGLLEWYVDNSGHNYQRTVWTRPVEPEEVELLNATTVQDANGNPIRHVIYLGKSQGEIRFRLRELTPAGENIHDAYSYELSTGNETIIAILGAEIEVSDVSNTGATVKMLKPFNEIVDYSVPQ